MRSPFALGAALLLLPAALAARQADDSAVEPGSLAVSVFGYLLPEGEGDYAQPTLAFDRGRLHLEARANYEGIDAGSVWAGWNSAGGESVEWEVTPMLGVVFGSTTGVAPGVKAWLGWGGLELYSEAELLFDAEDSSSSYFYAWSEATYRPAEFVRFGVVGQRTRVRETEREIERGLLLGLSDESVDLTLAVFEPGSGDPTVVVGLALGFGP
jgi:hypothetical protein